MCLFIFLALCTRLYIPTCSARAIMHGRSVHPDLLRACLSATVAVHVQHITACTKRIACHIALVVKCVIAWYVPGECNCNRS